MFTGIVTEVGRVRSFSRGGRLARLVIEAPRTTPLLKIGASVAVAGVCQTVVKLDSRSFTVECVPETLRRTTLGRLRTGSRVNLEPPLAAGDPLGGHLVAGHVDAVGVVTAMKRDPSSAELRLDLPEELDRLVVEKGSLAQ